MRPEYGSWNRIWIFPRGVAGCRESIPRFCVLCVSRQKHACFLSFCILFLLNFLPFSFSETQSFPLAKDDFCFVVIFTSIFLYDSIRGEMLWCYEPRCYTFSQLVWKTTASQVERQMDSTSLKGAQFPRFKFIRLASPQTPRPPMPIAWMI